MIGAGIGYSFSLNEEITKLISVFSNKSFDKYKYARCNKQMIRSRGAMLLKRKTRRASRFNIIVASELCFLISFAA